MDLVCQMSTALPKFMQEAGQGREGHLRRCPLIVLAIGPPATGKWVFPRRHLPALCNPKALDDATSMSDHLNTVTLDQMKAAVGSLLFLWSDIE